MALWIHARALCVGRAGDRRHGAVPIKWGLGDPGLFGANVISRDTPSNTVHCDVVGHAMPINEIPTSIVAEVVVPGDVGSKVTSCPEMFMDVHCVGVGQASALSLMLRSIETAVGVAEDVGSNVTSLPPVNRGAPGHGWACNSRERLSVANRHGRLRAGRCWVERHLVPGTPDRGALPGRRAGDAREVAATCPTATGLEAAGELGLNVTSSRAPTTMHSVVVGHATLDSASPRWIVVGGG